MRFRIAIAAAVIGSVLAIAATPAGAASSVPASPQATSIAPLYTLHVNGVGKNGKVFRGTYGIQRFVAGSQAVHAVGVLNGALDGRHVSRSDVKIPVKLTSRAAPAQATSCSVLHLVLGPVNLNLLGLQITLGGGANATQPIVLDITAVPGAGNLLGNLLCDLTNALNTGGVLGQLTGQLQQLASTLNGLVSLLGGL